jgi:VanZ family protein
VPAHGGPARELVSGRAQRILLIVWCCFVLYGSFIPFHFNTDPEFVRARLARVQLFPFQAGVKNFSLLDVVSNVLLFIPFGFLLSGSGVWNARRSWVLRVGTSGLLTLMFTAAIELGQLFSPGRTSSGIDVEAGVGGALIGAVAACLLRQFEEGVDTGVRLAQEEPRLVPIALMVLWLCSDAFYPFALTLDVSTVWHNLTHARLIPFRAGQRVWLDRVVDETVMFAMLSALMSTVLRRRVGGALAAVLAVLAGMAFSGLLEFGKLFFVARTPNVENVILASAGALLGATVVPLAVAWGPIKRRPERALAVVAFALLAYSELTPFSFDLAPSAVARQLGRAEWIPLLSYYGADPQSALFDLWKKLLLSGFWGFAFARLRDATPMGAACAGLVAGGLLEMAQVLTATRIPSISDVLNIGLGAWMGGGVYLRSRGLEIDMRRERAQ